LFDCSADDKLAMLQVDRLALQKAALPISTALSAVGYD